MKIAKPFPEGRRKLNSSQIIALGFAGVILLGALLLSVPEAAASGVSTPFVDALFTAATSVCVTGLVTVTTATHWSLFGQVVILLLIQLGGIGVVAMATIIFIGIGRRIGMRSRKLIQDSYNLDSMAGLVKGVRKILFGILGAEALGACFYAIRFVPQYGLPRGIWQSVFTSVSAFCNAGMDILGENSLLPYAGDWLVNLTTIALIIAGGLGFIVWWDLADRCREVFTKKLSPRRFWKKLRLHSRIVLCTTFFLILGGAFFIFLFEYGNAGTMGGRPLSDKVLFSLFQSVTTRTAGFMTVDQGRLSNASVCLSLLWMFIGGSPMGTAGGVKTTTITVLLFTMLAYVRGKDDTEISRRRVKESRVRSALVVVCAAFAVWFAMCLLLLALEPAADLVDVVYEMTSALATVGLSRGLTPSLSLGGKLAVVVTMYLGRIGPLTMATAIVLKAERKSNGVRLPEERVMIG